MATFNRASYNKPNMNIRCGKNATGDIPPEGQRLKFVSTDGLRTVSYKPVTEPVIRLLAANNHEGKSPLTIICELLKGETFHIWDDNKEARFTVYLD